MSFINGGIDRNISPDGLYKIGEVEKIKVAAGTHRVCDIVRYRFLNFFYQLIRFIKNFIIVVAIIYQRAFIAVNDKSSSSSFYWKLIAAAGFLM